MLYYFILHSHFHTKPLPKEFLNHVSDVGWGNGYVLIPPGHTLHGKDYESTELYAHGGLTFSSLYKNFKQLKRYEDSGYDYQMDEKLKEKVKAGYEFLDEYWCLGFDTAHFGDDLKTCTKEYVWNEAKSLHKLCVDADIKMVRRAKLTKIKNKERYER